MEILQAKVRLLQNFPQKVVLDTKKTKLSLIHIHINSEQWDQSNEYSDIITCMNIEMQCVYIGQKKHFPVRIFALGPKWSELWSEFPKKLCFFQNELQGTQNYLFYSHLFSLKL